MNCSCRWRHGNTFYYLNVLTVSISTDTITDVITATANRYAEEMPRCLVHSEEISGTWGLREVTLAELLILFSTNLLIVWFSKNSENHNFPETKVAPSRYFVQTTVQVSKMIQRHSNDSNDSKGKEANRHI